MTQFVLLKNFEDQYEIMTTYPFHLKHKETNIVYGGIYSEKDGMLVTINNRKHVKMHRLIAKQFLPGYSETKPIYHKNGDKFDNHLDNLTFKRSETLNTIHTKEKKLF